MARYRATGTVTFTRRFEVTFECAEPDDARSEAAGAVEMDVYGSGAIRQIDFDAIELEEADRG